MSEQRGTSSRLMTRRESAPRALSDKSLPGEARFAPHETADRDTLIVFQTATAGMG